MKKNLEVSRMNLKEVKSQPIPGLIVSSNDIIKASGNGEGISQSQLIQMENAALKVRPKLIRKK